MSILRAASYLHRWLALIVGVQIVFWVASGLFFSIFPIERVRSEHRIAAIEPAPFDPALVAMSHPVAGMEQETLTRLTFETNAVGRPVALAEFADRAPIVIDLVDKRVISPLSAEAAAALAQAHVAGETHVREVRRITQATPEYRGVLPAWRVALEDAEGLVVYVAADTGRVTARRSDLWRVYDALWALHIMDWRDHENFNNGLLILASALALIVSISGLILIPYRMGWMRPRVR
jgi:hypothetical protein